MARPARQRPPVAATAAVPAADRPERKDLVTYQRIVEGINRDDRMTALRDMLGSEDMVRRFLAVTLNSLATDSDLLLNANPITIIQAIQDSATLGLEPTGLTGEAKIIRYNDVAKLMPMWRGYLKRIRNSRKVQDVDTQLVYEHDEFDYGWSEKGGWFKHNPVKAMPKDGEDIRGDYWGAYAYAVMPSGFVELEVMPAIEINRIRDQSSQSWNGSKREASPWFTAWGEMARKTVVRRLSKRLPQEAVDALLALDEEADRAEQVSVSTIDFGAARQRALAAIAARGKGAGEVIPPMPPAAPALGSGEPSEPPATGDAAPPPPPADTAPAQAPAATMVATAPDDGVPIGLPLPPEPEDDMPF